METNKETVTIDVRNEHAAEIAERLAAAGGSFAEYGKPNTVLLPSRGSPPIPYYSPRRPTRRLRLLCWFVGARLDYLPDRVGFPKPPRTVPTPKPPEPPTKMILPPGVDPVIARRVLDANESIKE